MVIVRLGLSKKLDWLFEKTAEALGSTPVILLSVSWCAWAYARGNRDFLDVVSIVTFIFGELILRGQTVQSKRSEKHIKQDLKVTRRIERKL